MAIDLASIIAGSSQLGAQIANTAMETVHVGNQIADITKQRTDNLTTAANLQAQAQMVADSAALDTQNAKITAANALGTNVLDVSEIMTALGKRAREQALQVTQQQDALDQQRNSAANGNPLAAIRQYIFGEDQQSALNDKAAEFQQTSGLIQQLNAATQTIAQTQTAISAPLTKASIAASAEASRKFQQDKIDTITEEGLKFGLANVKDLQTLGAQEFNRQLGIYNAVSADRQYQEGAALRKQEFTLRQMQLDDAAKDKNYYQSATDQINTYRAASGLPLANPKEVERVITQPGPLGDQFRDQQWQGMRTQQTGGKVVFGVTPWESYTSINRDRVETPANYYPSMDIFETAESRVSKARDTVSDPAYIADPKNPVNTYGLNKGNYKDPKAVEAAFNAAAKDITANAAANVTLDSNNPYSPLPIPQVIQANPAIMDSPFGKTVLTTLATNNVVENDPERLVATTIVAIRNGDINYNDAVSGLAGFYQATIATKNATAGFTQLGLPTQQGFVTRLSGFRPQRTTGSLIPLPGVASGVLGVYNMIERHLDSRDKSAIYNQGIDISTKDGAGLVLQLYTAKSTAADMRKAVERNNP